MKRETNIEVVKLPAYHYFQSVSGSFLSQHQMHYDSWLNLDLQELFSEAKVIERNHDILRVWEACPAQTFSKVRF